MTALTLPAPEEKTRFSSSKLCACSPQHRCYQSLWHSSSSERINQVFGVVNERVWSPIVSAPWQKKSPLHWWWQIKWLRFWFFQWSGTFPLSSTHFLCLSALGASGNRYWFELRSCDYYSDCARTHRSRTDTKNWATPGVWAKLRKTDERRNAHICQYIHNIRTSALYNKHILHKVWSAFKS